MDNTVAEHVAAAGQAEYANASATSVEAKQALSSLEAYDFLKGSTRADESTLLSPLERKTLEIRSFSAYTTGTVELRLTPDILAAIEELRHMSVSAEFKKLAQFIHILQAKLTQLNQPNALLNPNYLAPHVPFCQTPEDVTDEMIHKSLWQVDIHAEHALIAGVPVWDRMEGERLDFYLLFKLYRDARYGLIDSGDYVLCSRSLAGLAGKLDLPTQLLNVISRIYHWAARCEYYDTFFEMEIARRRQMEVQLLQRDHLKFSTQLLTNSIAFLHDNQHQLTPKDAISMAELGFKFSRLSLGLAPDKPLLNGFGGDPSAQGLSIQVNNAEQMVQLNTMGQAESRLHENIKEDDNLLSILSVLQRSGAMTTALGNDLAKPRVIDVTPEEGG